MRIPPIILICFLLTFVLLVVLSHVKLPSIMLPKGAQHNTIAVIPFLKAIDRADYDAIQDDQKSPLDRCVMHYEGFCSSSKCRKKIRSLCAKSYAGALRCADVDKLFGNPMTTCWGGWQ